MALKRKLSFYGVQNWAGAGWVLNNNNKIIIKLEDNRIVIYYVLSHDGFLSLDRVHQKEIYCKL